MTVEQSDTIYLGLGCNLGDREQNLSKAMQAISSRVGPIQAISPIYITTPLNPPELDGYTQPEFLNACIAVESDLSPQAVLQEILSIETELGRDRTQELRWGPRYIDIDILLFGDTILNRSDLQIPHPALADRDFVLVPLADIAPTVRHPTSGDTITELLIDHTERQKERFVSGVYSPTLTAFANCSM